MVTSETSIVYKAPTRGRRYLTLHGALNAEARALILKRYPIEQPCGNDPYDGGDVGYYIVEDAPGFYNRMHSKLYSMLKSQYQKAAPNE